MESVADISVPAEKVKAEGRGPSIHLLILLEDKIRFGDSVASFSVSQNNEETLKNLLTKIIFVYFYIRMLFFIV